MRLLCDIDGVLADLLPEWLRAYEALGGEHIDPASVAHYEMGKVVQDESKCYLALATVDYANVKAYPGVAEGIAALRKQGFALRFVSYVPPGCDTHYAGKIAWLTKHVPGFKPAEAVFCASNEKQFVDGDILIEDYPRTLNEWMLARDEAGYMPFGVLIVHHYNNSVEVPQGVPRMASFAAAAEMLCADDEEEAA